MPTLQLPSNYNPRSYQLEVCEAFDRGCRRAALIWHRRAGKDKTGLAITSKELWQHPGVYWHLFPLLNQGRKILWDGRGRDGTPFLNAFPQEMRKRTLDQEMKIEFTNNSIWQIVGVDNVDSLVGANPRGIVFSEWSLMDPLVWKLLQPILLENGGWAMFIYTPRGKNHGHKTYLHAMRDPEWFCSLKTVRDTLRDSIGEAGGPVILESDIDKIRREGEEDGKVPDEDTIQQEYYCFPPGTKVWTNRGQVPIEKIGLEDVVLSHSGRWRKVTKLFERDYAGDIVTIASIGSYVPLNCTPNHPVRLCDPATQSYRWVSAGDVKVGDHVVLPRLKMQAAKIISAGLAELVAWFISEGSVAKTLVQFTVGSKEGEYANRIKSAAMLYGKTTIRKNGPTLVVTVNSCFLADFLTMNCGSGSANKRIPWTMISGHEEIVYTTLIDGDGCRGDYGGVSEVFTTISPSLAMDVQMLAHMIGNRAMVNRRPKENQTSVILGRKCNVSDSYSVRVSKNGGSRGGNRNLLPQKHGVAARVVHVERVLYRGPVHNLSVQYDESYHAAGRAVHNCSFSGNLQGAVYGTQMTMAEREGRIARCPWEPRFPVYTAWDLGVGDALAIGFFQVVGREWRWIDYFENRGGGMLAGIKEVKEKPYAFGRHYGPHDIETREISTGKSRKRFAEEHGLIFTVVPKHLVADGIDAVRRQYPSMVFDTQNCDGLVNAARSYRYEWDEKKQEFSKQPYHDWSSHGADMMRTGVCGYSPIATAPRPIVASGMDFNPLNYEKDMRSLPTEAIHEFDPITGRSW